MGEVLANIYFVSHSSLSELHFFCTGGEGQVGGWEVKANSIFF